MNAADSGPGTLRQALLQAQDNDTIIFDPAVFPPAAPVTISIASPLPHIYAHKLLLDGSNAGVILDGSQISGEWEAGLQIVSASATTIRGLQFSHFSGPGIAISGDAQQNIIGGNRNLGAGPFGQGNLFSDNNMGISLSTSKTAQNIITGNLIGSDAAGTAELGNQAGIWINEDAHNNIVGPDNIIAHNSGAGIVIQDSKAVYNTITQNSIHDNGGPGIALWNDGNAELAEPLIFDFDLQAGIITGASCPFCTLEIFSDSSDEGGIYEGRTTASAQGHFAFDKNIAFAGPNLTATTTDLQGNTSEFSLPTSVSSRTLKLQQGNDRHFYPFQARCSAALLDNHLGTFWGQVQNVGGWGDFNCSPQGVKGLKMVKLSFNEVEDWPFIDWSLPEMSITPEQDAFVTGLAESGITITYILNFWDKANHPQGWPEIPSRFTTEEEIQRYLDYVRFIVGHFKDRVPYFELWNEPDNRSSAIQHIKPEDYVELVRRVVPVIKEEFPEAQVVIGSVVLRDPYAQYYLNVLLESDIMPLVDVVAWHPMYGTSPDFADERDYYYALPGMIENIKKTAVAHGFQGEFRADEIGWCSPDIGDCGGALHMHSNTVAAKYHGRGILMHLGRDIDVHLGGMSVQRRETTAIVSNLATVMAGSWAESVPIQVQTSITNVVSYTFGLPNEGSMIALWNDGVAVDNDAGQPATLILPGLAGQSVVGIDALYGFTQPIITSVEDGNLVIHNLLIKDYPIILRITPTRAAFLPLVIK